jgi:hypothetical protein
MYRVDVGDELEPLRVIGADESVWEWHTDVSLVSKAGHCRLLTMIMRFD